MRVKSELQSQSRMRRKRFVVLYPWNFAQPCGCSVYRVLQKCACGPLVSVVVSRWWQQLFYVVIRWWQLWRLFILLYGFQVPTISQSNQILMHVSLIYPLSVHNICTILWSMKYISSQVKIKYVLKICTQSHISFRNAYHEVHLSLLSLCDILI